MVGLTPRLLGRTVLGSLGGGWFSSISREGGLESSTSVLVMASARPAAPLLIAPSPFPTFSASLPSCRPSKQGRGLSWAARQLLAYLAKSRALGPPSAGARAWALEARNLGISPSSVIPCLGAQIR